MDQEFANLLAIFDAQGIADKLQADQTPWSSATGMKAQVALAVLNAGQIERAVKALDESAANLSAASDRIAKWGVFVAWCSLFVALVALAVAFVR
jgi:hypothetical protein